MKSKISSFFKKSKFLSDIWAILLLALGVFLLMYPDTAIKFVCQLIGIGTVLYGLVLIISFLIVGTRTPYGNPNIFRVIFGVLLLVMGLYVSVRPFTIVEFAGVLFAILLYAWSINQFLEMKNLVEFRDPRWWIALLSGVVTVILGCVVMFAPIESTELLLRVAGFGLVYAAVSGLFLNFRAIHYGIKYEKTYGPLIEDVTGQPLGIAHHKEAPPVIDGEVRVVEDENTSSGDGSEKGKKEKRGFFHRKKKVPAEESSPQESGETDAAAGAETETGNGSPQDDGCGSASPEGAETETEAETGISGSEETDAVSPEGEADADER